LGLEISFLDLVTIGWDGWFSPSEHEDRFMCVEEY